MSKALIIQVGANLKENKGLSPIFSDNTYEYIPSLLDSNFNSNKHHNHKHYSKMSCQNPHLAEMHLSSFVNEGTGHVDPEFYSYTYGESRSAYSNLIKKLNDGDLLVFSIILQKYLSKKDKFVLSGDPQLYIFSYFRISNSKNDILEISGEINKEFLNGFEKTCNEHIIYSDQHIKTPENKKLLLVQGDHHESLLFKKPLKISSGEKIQQKFIKSWKIEKAKENLEAYWCNGFPQILNDLKKHSDENRWVEWVIP